MAIDPDLDCNPRFNPGFSIKKMKRKDSEKKTLNELVTNCYINRDKRTSWLKKRPSALEKDGPDLTSLK